MVQASGTPLGYCRIAYAGSNPAALPKQWRIEMVDWLLQTNESDKHPKLHTIGMALRYIIAAIGVAFAVFLIAGTIVWGP